MRGRSFKVHVSTLGLRTMCAPPTPAGFVRFPTSYPSTSVHLRSSCSPGSCLPSAEACLPTVKQLPFPYAGVLLDQFPTLPLDSSPPIPGETQAWCTVTPASHTDPAMPGNVADCSMAAPEPESLTESFPWAGGQAAGGRRKALYADLP